MPPRLLHAFPALLIDICMLFVSLSSEYHCLLYRNFHLWYCVQYLSFLFSTYCYTGAGGEEETEIPGRV